MVVQKIIFILTVHTIIIRLVIIQSKYGHIRKVDNGILNLIIHGVAVEHLVVVVSSMDGKG
jgi:hypothetical protein